MSMTTTMPTDTHKLFQTLTVYLSATLSMGFLLWTIGSDVTIIQQSKPDLLRYAMFLMTGLVTGGIICLLLRLSSGSLDSAKVFGYVSCLVYFSCLKALDWVFVPWVIILIIAALISLPRIRKLNIPARSVLLLHGMGTMSGLYMSVHLQEFLEGWEPFKEVLAGLLIFLIY